MSIYSAPAMSLRLVMLVTKRAFPDDPQQELHSKNR